MIKTDQMAGELWSDEHTDAICECRTCGTRFQSRGKFSGSLIAIVSFSPCPKCGDHEMRKIEGVWEHQQIDSKDVRNVSQ